VPLSVPVQNAQFTHSKHSLEKTWHTNRAKAKDRDGFAGKDDRGRYSNGNDLRGYSTISASFFLDMGLAAV
jgi:hypothetical protein